MSRMKCPYLNILISFWPLPQRAARCVQTGKVKLSTRKIDTESKLCESSLHLWQFKQGTFTEGNVPTAEKDCGDWTSIFSGGQGTRMKKKRLKQKWRKKKEQLLQTISGLLSIFSLPNLFYPWKKVGCNAFHVIRSSAHLCSAYILNSTLMLLPHL